MKIFLDNIVFGLQSSGGVSVVWYELLKRLLIDDDVELKVIEYENQNIFRKKLVIPSELIINNPWPKLPLKMKRYFSPKLLNQEGIFHSSDYRIVNHPGIINVTTVHDFIYEYFRHGIPRLVHQYQQGKAINKSNKIICVSENTKKDLLVFYPQINESQIKVIYNGVNPAYKIISINREIQLKSLIPFTKGKYILYIGDRRGQYKNFRMAVEACSIVNIPIVIVGGGILTDSEKAYMTVVLKNNYFISLVDISNENLNLLYNYAFCLLYPSSYEGFGIPIVEAQKAGCPVICSNCSSLPEVAGNGALYLENIDVKSIVESIKILSSNLAKRNDIIISGIKNVNRFSWDKCYLQTKELYEEIYKENFRNR